MKLRIFYDSQCPLCAAEMQHIKALDIHENVELQDLNQADFESNYPYIDLAYANKILHGERADGTIIKGLDVTYEAWAKGWGSVKADNDQLWSAAALHAGASPSGPPITMSYSYLIVMKCTKIDGVIILNMRQRYKNVTFKLREG